MTIASTHGAWAPFKGTAASTTGALTNTSVQATPGAGKYLVLRQFILSNEGAANSFALLDGSGGTSLVGTIYLGANQTLTYKLLNPIKLTANTALCVTTTATDHANIVCEGSIE
jgi:hypothetical protein